MRKTLRRPRPDMTTHVFALLRHHPPPPHQKMKMGLEILLNDEVFVDFFNTYLSLPVFGQTPLYMMNQNKWLMWPNVPFTQVNTGEFLKWLEMHRMVFFRRTELYHFFLLCTEILDFVSCKSTVDLKWTPADQWLVRKCLGSVRGIQRLRSFLKSSDAEEELLLFCVRASMILRIKEEETEEAFQTLNRQALHTAIRRYDVTALLSRDCPLISQKRVLAEMRTSALNQLQSYWLPHFLHCCKSSMWRIPECRPVVEKYISICSPSSRSPSSTERKQKDPDFTVHPARSYDSKRSKRHLWSSQHKPKNTHQSKSICLWLPPSAQTNLQCSNVAHPPEETKNKAAIESDDDANIHHTCIQTPACQIPFCVDINSPPSDIQFLQPALSAEGLSGGPFRYFLGARELLEERLMLDLLEDLDFFLLLLLKAQGEDPVCALRQTAARRITETYLKENKPRFIRHLDAEIRQNLSSLLPSSAALPWIYKAKYHLCKELREVYNSFLDADDEALLSLLSSDGNGLEDSVPLLFSSFGTETDALLAQTEALMLCEGCCARLDPADLNHDSWTLVALQDPHRGGSLLHKYNTTDAPEEPKPASMTDTTQPAQDPPKSKTTVPEVQIKTYKKDNIFNEKPTTKPRSFEEVITSHTYFNHFLQFLQTQGADGALLFIQDAEALRSIEHKRQKAKICLIVDKYFRRDDPADYLQCSADIITRVSQMDKVFPELIYTIQHLVAKSLEATWFRLYQDTFSVCPHASESDEDIKGPLLMGKLKANAWEVFISFIRSVIKFQSGMVNREIRAEFEDYLVQNYEHYSTPYVVRSKANHSSELSTDGEKYKPKIRCIMDKLVTVDFLVNDLCFYLECERFRRMADAGDKMVSEGLYSESDYAMLHHKAELIINIFLTSQISPKLLINSSEAQKEVVLQRFASGKVDRTLFYQPVVDLFPVLIFCWRKFCCLKVMRHLYPSKALMMVKSLRPLNLQQEFQIIRSTEVKEATLRFSSQHGLVLLLPQAN
ncbi:regulator of G-protein signaling protein-like isoform X8 [Danio rerio]|uniref:Regulator of G-protein signaling protein-like isoform X8 n=2 Tax=Danio rerio TaxID=7955 RepID=A0AC58JT06_DANRE